MRAGLGSITMPVQLAYLPGSFAWGCCLLKGGVPASAEWRFSSVKYPAWKCEMGLQALQLSVAYRAAHRIWAARGSINFLTEVPSWTASCSHSGTAGIKMRCFTMAQGNKNHLLTGGRCLAYSLILFFCLRLDFIYDLFERVCSRCSEETLKMGTQRRRPTVSSQFRVWCFPREQQASGEEQMGKAKPAAKRSHSSLFCVQHWKCAGMLQC